MERNLAYNKSKLFSAVLTGCKNVAAAHKVGPYEVEVPDWGVRFRTAREVKDGLKAIGIRAHYFSPATKHNRFPARYAEEMGINPVNILLLY